MVLFIEMLKSIFNQDDMCPEKVKKNNIDRIIRDAITMKRNY